MTDDDFRSAAETLGVDLDHEAVSKFARYHDELVEANSRTNLTAITERNDVYAKHFLDSLSCLAFVRGGDRRVVDVGSGAGFPGIPMKIALPHLSLTLVESVRKKAEFLEQLVATLGLQDVKILPMRVEDVAFDPADRERYDVAVARAVASVATLGEYLLPLLKLDGRMIAPKGADPSDEVQTADVATVGGAVERVHRVDVPHVEGDRHLVVVRKIVPTPSNYPRRSGAPHKRPLKRKG